MPAHRLSSAAVHPFRSSSSSEYATERRHVSAVRWGRAMLWPLCASRVLVDASTELALSDWWAAACRRAPMHLLSEWLILNGMGCMWRAGLVSLSSVVVLLLAPPSSGCDHGWLGRRGRPTGPIRSSTHWLRCTGALSQTANRDISLCVLAGSGVPNSNPGPCRARDGGPKLALTASDPADIPKVRKFQQWVTDHWYPEQHMPELPCVDLEIRDKGNLWRAKRDLAERAEYGQYRHCADELWESDMHGSSRPETCWCDGRVRIGKQVRDDGPSSRRQNLIASRLFAASMKWGWAAHLAVHL